MNFLGYYFLKEDLYMIGKGKFMQGGRWDFSVYFSWHLPKLLKSTALQLEIDGNPLNLELKLTFLQ